MSTIFRNTFFPPKTDIWAPPNGSSTSQHQALLGRVGALLSCQNSVGLCPFCPGSPDRPKQPICPEQGGWQGWGSGGRKSHAELSSFNAQKAENLYLQSATQGTAERARTPGITAKKGIMQESFGERSV